MIARRRDTHKVKTCLFILEICFGVKTETVLLAKKNTFQLGTMYLRKKHVSLFVHVSLGGWQSDPILRLEHDHRVAPDDHHPDPVLGALKILTT